MCYDMSGGDSVDRLVRVVGGSPLLKFSFWSVPPCPVTPVTRNNQLFVVPEEDFTGMYTDKALTCRDCGNQFTLTAGGDAFHALEASAHPRRTRPSACNRSPRRKRLSHFQMKPIRPAAQPHRHRGDYNWRWCTRADCGYRSQAKKYESAPAR